MDLLGDMAADRQIKGDAAVSDGNCEGGQTGAAEFSVLLSSRHKVTVTRSGVVHEGTHGGGSYAGGLGLTVGRPTVLRGQRSRVRNGSSRRHGS